MLAQQWLSAGLEAVALLLMLVAGWLLARPRRWTLVVVGVLCALAWTFHERAVYFVPVLFAIAWLYSGLWQAWRDNRRSWLVLVGVTLLALGLRVFDGLPGRTPGTSIPGALWSAGPGSVLRSVLGWLPFDVQQRTVVPVAAGLWAVAVLAVWMVILLIGLATQPRQTVLVAGVTAALLLAEVLSFVVLRGGFAGAGLAADPRFTLVTGTVLLAGIGSFDFTWRPVVAVAAAVALLGSWSMWTIARPVDPGRQWLAQARALRPGADLAATPSPPRMLAHFFFITDPPVYELGTTRTLLQVGPEPARFPEQAARPLKIDESGAVGPLEFTALLVSQRRQCGEVRVPELDAGVRVIGAAPRGWWDHLCDAAAWTGCADRRRRGVRGPRGGRHPRTVRGLSHEGLDRGWCRCRCRCLGLAQRSAHTVPEPFAPFRDVPELEHAPLPAGLPEPVARYFEVVCGQRSRC